MYLITVLYPNSIFLIIIINAKRSEHDHLQRKWSLKYKLTDLDEALLTKLT